MSNGVHQCSNCWYVRTSTYTGADGALHSTTSSNLSCRFNAPMPQTGATANSIRVGWRMVLATDWCGEWSADGVPREIGPAGPPGHSDIVYGSATVDFGAAPVGDASVVVTDQDAITADAAIQVWVQSDPVADMMLRFTAEAGADEFTIRADSIGALVSGTVPLRWSWANG